VPSGDTKVERGYDHGSRITLPFGLKARAGVSENPASKSICSFPLFVIWWTTLGVATSVVPGFMRSGFAQVFPYTQDRGFPGATSFARLFSNPEVF
jgi:hypothetical protein